ncbi:hypothetical protein LEMLEM_LOCUS9107, partial [Lemmus lemmus]
GGGGLLEKETEAGRAGAALHPPWHDPGLRLQRLHKETVLGAAVPLLDSCCATWTVEERLPSFHPTATPQSFHREDV